MDELSIFCKSIKDIIESQPQLGISEARQVIKNINEFLYTNYIGIDTTEILGGTYKYFSDFHKYWDMHHKEILNCQIIETQCEKVADALHDVYKKTNGSVFKSLYDTCGLSPENICRVRFLSANQDFRGTRNFNEFAELFNSDNSIFDEDVILLDPAIFLKKLNITNLSQGDKRISYAKNIAQFIKEKNCSPYELIKFYDRDIYKLRNDIINCTSGGYGNKKADMFVRDMVVLGIWNDVRGFENIDVASDINTIKVALRTGIIKTEIPLVSSFLDIFCYQYSYIDEMNAKAWRRVWEIWQNKYANECIASPCLIDYFVYRVIGKQFCKENLFVFKCDTYNHTFKWHSGKNKTCQICYQNKIKGMKAHVIKRVMACTDPEGNVAIKNSDFVLSLPKGQKFDTCPFVGICKNNHHLMPPKSISILGQTGWTSAYTMKDKGGGGLMS